MIVSGQLELLFHRSPEPGLLAENLSLLRASYSLDGSLRRRVSTPSLARVLFQQLAMVAALYVGLDAAIYHAPVLWGLQRLADADCADNMSAWGR